MTSSEVWNDSMNDLARLTFKTIEDYYNPDRYSRSREDLHSLLWSDIKDRLRGKDRAGTFCTDRFFRTFQHWCEYHGNDADRTSSYVQLREHDYFMKELLDKVEARFVEKYGLGASKVRYDTISGKSWEEVKALKADAAKLISDSIRDPSNRTFPKESLKTIMAAVECPDICNGWKHSERSSDSLWSEVLRHLTGGHSVPDRWKENAIKDLEDIFQGRYEIKENNGLKR